MAEKISKDTKKVNLNNEQIDKYREKVIQYKKELSELNKKYKAHLFDDEDARYVILEDNNMQIFFEEYYDEYYDGDDYDEHIKYYFYGVDIH